MRFGDIGQQQGQTAEMSAESTVENYSDCAAVWFRLLDCSRTRDVGVDTPNVARRVLHRCKRINLYLAEVAVGKGLGLARDRQRSRKQQPSRRRCTGWTECECHDSRTSFIDRRRLAIISLRANVMPK